MTFGDDQSGLHLIGGEHTVRRQPAEATLAVIEAELRLAALEDLFAMMLDAWQAGRNFDGSNMADLVQATRELADELNPETTAVGERRLRRRRVGCDLFVDGSDADRAVLVDMIGRSPDLLWVLDENLSAVRPTDEATTLRSLAVVSLMAAHVDRRDLLMRLRTLQEHAEGSGVDLSPLVARCRPGRRQRHETCW